MLADAITTAAGRRAWRYAWVPWRWRPLRNAIEAYMFFDTTGREYHILEDLYVLFMSWGT
jgi:hypothetical protein